MAKKIPSSEQVDILYPLQRQAKINLGEDGTYQLKARTVVGESKAAKYKTFNADEPFGCSEGFKLAIRQAMIKLVLNPQV